MMGDLRLLTLEEALEKQPEVVWLQLRWWHGTEPVRFWAEHIPFLVFAHDDLRGRFELRHDQYGITWRCFSQNAVDECRLPWADGDGLWEIEEEPEGDAT